MTTSPGGECGSGLGSFGDGFHLLAIPVVVLRTERKIVSRRAIPSSWTKLKPNNAGLMRQPMIDSHARGPNGFTDGLGMFSFSDTRTHVTVFAASLSPRCKACAT